MARWVPGAAPNGRYHRRRRGLCRSSATKAERIMSWPGVRLLLSG